jgi:hypothetical protein
MKYINSKLLFVVLLLGFLVALQSVVDDFTQFYSFEQTIFRVQNTYLPNPIFTPCFWGMWMFLLCLVYSYFFAFRSKTNLLFTLKNLLLFGTAFGWVNVLYLTYVYVSSSNAIKISYYCTGGNNPENPLYSSCFIGTVFFTLSMVISVYLYKVYLKEILNEKSSDNRSG